MKSLVNMGCISLLLDDCEVNILGWFAGDWDGGMGGTGSVGILDMGWDYELWR